MLSCAPLVASVILGRESSSGTQYGGLRQTKAPSFKEGLYIQIRTTERHDGNNTLTLGGHVLSGSSSLISLKRATVYRNCRNRSVCGLRHYESLPFRSSEILPEFTSEL
jgi:hypothetical protein